MRLARFLASPLAAHGVFCPVRFLRGWRQCRPMEKGGLRLRMGNRVGRQERLRLSRISEKAVSRMKEKLAPDWRGEKITKECPLGGGQETKWEISVHENHAVVPKSSSQ